MSDEPFKVDVTLRTDQAIVSRVSLASGAETGEHSHEHDYVVIPHQATTLVKTTFQDGKQVSQEQIEHAPGQPYFVAKSASGVTFSIKNIGDGPMMCDKTFIRPPKQ